MDGSTFDRLARAVGSAGSRRHLLGVLATLGGLLTHLDDDESAAKRRHGRNRGHRPGKSKDRRKGKRKGRGGRLGSPANCSPQTCAGCCDDSGVCRTGENAAACGTGENPAVPVWKANRAPPVSVSAVRPVAGTAAAMTTMSASQGPPTRSAARVGGRARHAPSQSPVSWMGSAAFPAAHRTVKAAALPTASASWGTPTSSVAPMAIAATAAIRTWARSATRAGGVSARPKPA